MKTSQRRALIWITILCAIVLGWWLGHRYLHDPKVAILPADRLAPWIVYPSSPRTNIHLVADLDTRFRRNVTLMAVPDQAMLHYRGLRSTSVKVNGNIVAKSQGNWKTVQKADVASHLHIGDNTLEIVVINDSAPAALSAQLVLQNRAVATDTSWSASIAGSTWRDARLASTAADHLQLTPDFPPPSTFQALVDNGFTLLIFALVSLLAMTLHARIGFTIDQRTVWWAMLIAAVLWAALFINNAPVLGIIGYDARFHLDYIQYILDHSRLPTADQGAEMHQPPLYYLISAVILKACGHTIIDQSALNTLRMVSMVFGVAHLMLIGVGLRLLMRGKPAQQLIGFVVASFIPLHLYAFEYPTNELLAAMLTTGVLVLGLRILQQDEPQKGWLAALGVCMGAALLSKVTPVIAGVLLLTAILAKTSTRPRPWRTAGKCMGITTGSCLVVCGWFYFSIWQEHGQLLMTGWELAGQRTWWGDPGIATAGFFTRFGQSLHHPIYSSFTSMPDGFYSTLFGDGLVSGRAALPGSVPWNLPMMLSGYLLALPVLAAMLLGAALTLWRWLRQHKAEYFLIVSFPAAMLGAMAYLAFSLQAPNYPQSRAIFALGAMLPMCALAAYGFDAVAKRHIVLRWIVIVLISIWAINSFASFWIVRGSDNALVYRAWHTGANPQHMQRTRRDMQTVLSHDPKNRLARISIARMAGQQRRHDVVDAVLHDLQNDYPQAASIRRWLAFEALSMGQVDLAEQHYQAAIEINPNDSHAHDALASMLMQQNQLDRAINHFRHALHSLNDNPDVHAQLAAAYSKSGQDDLAARHRDIAQRLRAARKRSIAGMEGQSP